MNHVSTESELNFEVTFDSPTLFVGMVVLDDTGVSPVIIGAVQPMLNVYGNLYRGKFTPEFGKKYLIFKGVFTDNTYATLDVNYPSGSESFVCEPVKIADGQIVVKKNKVLAAFPFPMLDILNQNPTTGLTVTAQRSLDGGAFAACTNPVTEIGNGFYKIDLSAADTNGDTIAFNFSAVGADNSCITVVTQR